MIKKIVTYTLLTLLINPTLIPQTSLASTAAIVTSPFLYTFNGTGSLVEAGSMADTWSPYWWLNSGAYFKLSSGRGATNKGVLPLNDPWRLLYAVNNPQDTDNGLHPQNIFRLLTRSEWQDARQEAYFVIKANNLSKSSNRNASNGLLLFNRYQDSDNLYYTGVRVDGSAIVKKKVQGNYYTMAEIKNVYGGVYNHESQPNLLPLNKWIGIRSELTNENNGTVRIKLFIDKGWQGKWQQVANVLDDGATYGGAAISITGFGGIRTDFMDVEFEN